MAGILVQVLASVFIVYLSIPALNIPIQNGLFWIILIFSSLNAITKGFIAEPVALQNYMQQLVPPYVIISARLIFNWLLVIIITLIIGFFFNLFIHGFVGFSLNYISIVLLSNIGISSTFTLMSALVRKLSNAYLIIPVISLPITIPILTIGLNASKKAMDDLAFIAFQKDIVLLIAICLFTVVMTVILYGILDRN